MAAVPNYLGLITTTIPLLSDRVQGSAHLDETRRSSCSEPPPEGRPGWVGSRAVPGLAVPAAGVLGGETCCAKASDGDLAFSRAPLDPSSRRW